MTQIEVPVWVAHVEKEGEFGSGFSVAMSSKDGVLTCLRSWLAGTLGAHFETLALTEVEDAFERNGFDVDIEEHQVEFEIT